MTISLDQETEALIIPTASGRPLQIVRWTGKRASVTAGASALRITLPPGAVCIELTAVKNIFLTFGDDAVVTTKVIEDDGARIFMGGVQVIPVPFDVATGKVFTHLSVISDTQPGIVQVEQVA